MHEHRRYLPHETTYVLKTVDPELLEETAQRTNCVYVLDVEDSVLLVAAWEKSAVKQFMHEALKRMKQKNIKVSD
jgi:hypothetical protein